MLSLSRRFARSVPRTVIASTTDAASTISAILNTFSPGLMFGPTISQRLFATTALSDAFIVFGQNLSPAVLRS